MKPLQTPRVRFLENLSIHQELAVAHDLSDSEYNPPNCPNWAKETFPDFIQPYRGRNGLPHPYRARNFPMAMTVEGLDRYQANQGIAYRPETENFLYQEYTSLKVNYRKGLLLAFENLAAEVTVGCRSDTAKALALLKCGTARVKHPDGPPCGRYVPGNRNLDDDALLASGSGWCNEQARVFIRLCQVSHIPARLIQLNYSDEKSGHCVAEFYADGRWSLADATWFCVFPDEQGRLLSAAECHDGAAGQAACGRAYYQRWQELLALSDPELNFPSPEATAEFRRLFGEATPESLADKLYLFAVLNYPLPH